MKRKQHSTTISTRQIQKMFRAEERTALKVTARAGHFRQIEVLWRILFQFEPRSGATMMQLFDGAGRRKYLTPAQRLAFLRAAELAPRDVFTFCATLAHGGCRISEALALTAPQVDRSGRTSSCLKASRNAEGEFFARSPSPAIFWKRSALFTISMHSETVGCGPGREQRLGGA